jgi:hypothetical protein
VTLLYRASKLDCDVCALKSRCCPKEPARKVPRSLFDGARDMARHIARSDVGRTSRRQRKKVEILFAHLKRIVRLLSGRAHSRSALRPKAAATSTTA